VGGVHLRAILQQKEKINVEWAKKGAEEREQNVIGIDDADT
jgi:hypothetical protein